MAGRRPSYPLAVARHPFAAVNLISDPIHGYLELTKRLSRDEAYMLCSLAADLHVTQAVDATKGVHATIAKAIFSR